jgi:hypothetical protein
MTEKENERQLRKVKESEKISERYSLPGKHRKRNTSGHRKQASDGVVLTNWKTRRDTSRHGMKANEQEALTLWRTQSRSKSGRQKGELARALTSWRVEREEVRIATESELERGTYILEHAERRTSRHHERTRAGERHSLPTECGERDNSGNRKKANERAWGTHELKNIEGVTNHVKWASEGHSHTENRRERDMSRHQKKERGRGKLTSWRAQSGGQVRTPRKSEASEEHSPTREYREGNRSA